MSSHPRRCTSARHVQSAEPVLLSRVAVQYVLEERVCVTVNTMMVVSKQDFKSAVQIILARA